jgi:hypothetical protein
MGVPGPRLSPELAPVIESTELAAACRAWGLCDGPAHSFELDLVRPDRRLDLEGRHAGVLADGVFAVGGQVDVLGDDAERLRRTGRGGFFGHRVAHRRPHVRGRSVDVFTISSSRDSKKASAMREV